TYTIARPCNLFRGCHQPRRPPHTAIRPGSPTIGPGTATGTKTIYAGAQLAMQVDRVTQILFRLSFPRRHVGPTTPPRDRSALGGVAFSPRTSPAYPSTADLTQTETVNECLWRSKKLLPNDPN